MALLLVLCFGFIGAILAYLIISCEIDSMVTHISNLNADKQQFTGVSFQSNPVNPVPVATLVQGVPESAEMRKEAQQTWD